MYIPPAIASETRELTPAHQAVLPWLDMLRQLYPPAALLLVGAGSGSSPWVQYLMATGHRNVTLIEADETTANRLKVATQGHPDWTVESHVIGRHSAPTPFYTASLQTESGLLESESLRSLWPNLKTTHTQTRQAVTLAELQKGAATPPNWLMVDCLPALQIIEGAAQQLSAFDVIALRVVLNDNAISASAASADELRPVLQALGFRCVALEPSRHPFVGHALFVRDTAAAARQLQQQLAQQAQALARAKAATEEAEERAAQLAVLTQAKIVAEKRVVECMRHAECLRQTLAAAQKIKLHFKQIEIEDGKTATLPEPDQTRSISGRAVASREIEYGGSIFDFFYRPDSVGDNGVIKQIFEDKQYEFGWLPQGKALYALHKQIIEEYKTPLIIDAGANIGASSAWFDIKFKKSAVLAIEPDADNCEMIRLNCAGRNTFILEGALADKERTLFFSDPGESDWGFRVVEEGARPVSCVGVNEILNEFDSAAYTPLILKIDIEGGESLVFKGACDWLKKIPMVIIELHDWMLPGQRSSENFLVAITHHNFEIITRGENVMCFNRNLLKI